MSSTARIVTFALLGLASASARTPKFMARDDPQGACDPPQGGDSACGPNGSEDWLNTGLKDGGWEPPSLSVDEVKHISAEDYYNGVGSACAQYDSAFQASGSKYNIDPAILAVLAMQESSCNADAGGPTPGLMQCDPSNCPNGSGSCQYPVEDNVDCGASVLRNALDNADGNFIHAIGSYNGWFTASDNTGLNGGKGLTEDYPCSDEGKSNGVPQNLDYLHEVLNGFLQGKDIYGDDSDLGGYYNCEQNCDSGLC